MNNYRFILTKDLNTVKKLKKLGFQEIGHSGGNHLFLNAPDKMSNEISMGTIVYTNVMLFNN